MDALLTAFTWPAFWAIFIGLEFWGATTGLWDVWLCMKEDIKNFPIGILNITILLRGLKNTKEVAVSIDLEWPEAVIAGIIGCFGTWAFGRYLGTTGDPSPLLDASLAVWSVVAQYFMSKKVIQCWYIWISVDVVSIWVYAHTNLYITAGLYFVFLCMCVRGLYDWKNEPTYKKLSVGKIPATT